MCHLSDDPRQRREGHNTGERGGFIVFDLKDTAQIPAVAEPFFLAFYSSITFTPVMNAQDLANAAPGIEKAVKEHAASS